MFYYSYDPYTKEYTGKGEADINPEATKRAGHDVYWAPAYATLDEPPIFEDNRVAIFDEEAQKWIAKVDYRGQYICDNDLNVLVVSELGEIPEGYILITQEQFDQIQNDFDWFIVKDGKLIKNPDYDKIKEKKHKAHIMKLAMTKYDFFKYVCLPNDITYPQLLQMVQSNEEVAAAWDLCWLVFRGDEVLCSYIFEYLPILTEEALNEIFEKYGKVINE